MTNLLGPLKLSLDAINWGRLLLATLAGAVAWTIASILLGIDPLAYGAVLFPNASETVQDLVGVISILVACLLFAFIWVLFFVPVKVWPYLVKLVIAALAITTLSHLLMPGETALTVKSMWMRFFTFVIALFVISLVYEGLPWKKDTE